ncbi:6-phosphogluconate dehydrogenase, decarboxylating [Thioalkalivibrio nitratireducens DSM 14787]|uniref:6-phosphogluconate dehydrogenase, decarboxylating n=1 Tax=Thioalkalivibrio nitratireducens (strain DSM 14787 / UNIQEM 213 / ALEN2) TaxID=1255043 RepID=L0DZP4_THIND|nr:decarboxylating NADP(+)-dependent phosphogluconate dehydrogenase [Thioalkalivibrio nitratireducens]AGA34462.1 6-phosphogluconate dehydrogenase, decarboxylating [Thioalkalivibrio nitratireducens DSM 14787]
MAKADIGLIGLAVMGQNLVLNMADHGYRVAVFNRTTSRVDAFVDGPAKGRSIVGCSSIEELVDSLERPRKVMLMVKAGPVVDEFIAGLVPLLDPGDVIIDGGNSHYPDSTRRTRELRERGLRFIGAGISGGEEGARHGPSIMPGGDPEAWPLVREIFQSIAAQVDGVPCCRWVGPDGAGHFVKMVHNGIEYGDMQLISEAYALMEQALGMDHDAMAAVFADWNRGVLDSYLIGITAEILTVKDSDGAPLVTHILDAAGQKGTGKWTGISALELGVPLTLIAEAVFARVLSSLKDERVQAAGILGRPQRPAPAPPEEYLDALHDALYASKIISYAQGFMLMREATQAQGWTLNYGDIALIWRGGCIIRSVFLNDIKAAYDQNPKLQNLVLDDFFARALNNAETGWRRAATLAISHAVPTPAFASALAYFDGYRSARLPANLLQAQRDYFGAHSYERVDRERGTFFHTDWTGHGGDVASSTYEA